MTTPTAPTPSSASSTRWARSRLPRPSCRSRPRACRPRRTTAPRVASLAARGRPRRTGASRGPRGPRRGASGPIATVLGAAEGGNQVARSRSMSAATTPIHLGRYRAPAVGGDARRHRPGRHRLRDDGGRAQPRPRRRRASPSWTRIVVPMPICDDAADCAGRAQALPRSDRSGSWPARRAARRRPEHDGQISRPALVRRSVPTMVTTRALRRCLGHGRNRGIERVLRNVRHPTSLAR